MSGIASSGSRRRGTIETIRVEVDGEHYLLIGIPRARQVVDWAVTPTERLLIEGIAAGLSNRELAEKRGTALRTIANQLQTLYRKLGVTSRGELRSILLGVKPGT